MHTPNSSKSSSLQKVLWLPFQHTNVLNDKGNQRQKSFCHLVHFVFSEGGCYVYQSKKLYYQKSALRNYPNLMKKFLLLYCIHHIYCTVEPLLILDTVNILVKYFINILVISLQLLSLHLDLNLIHRKLLNFTQYLFFFDRADSKLCATFFEMFCFF